MIITTLVGYITKLNKKYPGSNLRAGDFWCPRLQRQLASILHSKKTQNQKTRRYKIVGEMVLARDGMGWDGMYYLVAGNPMQLSI